MSLGFLKRSTVVLISTLLILALAQGQSRSTDEWAGRYEYDAYLGRTAGGTGIAISYIIKISSSDSKLGAVVEANGYQTDDKIRCDTRTQGNRINLYFNSYPNGGDLNQYGVRLYKRGDFLLSLERTSYRNKRRYKARWGKYNTDLTKSVLFIKTK